MRNLIFFLLIVSQLNSQNISFEGKLLDKETKKPIVYANISFLKSNKGISTNEMGVFSMNLDKKFLNFKVHISCLNYKDTIVLASNLYNKTLYLKNNKVLLDEIILRKRLFKQAIIGKVKNNVQGVHTSGMRMLAKYFPKDKRTQCCSYLKDITIHFAKRNQHRKKSKFRIRIFSVDKKTGLPNQDLLNVNLPIKIKQGQSLAKLDVSDYSIKMPNEGVFIAFEKLFIPFNQYGKNESDTENEFFYAPIIGFTKYSKKDRNTNLYYYVKGKWMLSPLMKSKMMRKYAPAIELKLRS